MSAASTPWDALLHGWSFWMSAMAWQVLVVAAAVGVLTLWRRRVPARLRHFLWGLVFVKLLLPPWLAAPWSAAPAVEHAVSGTAPAVWLEGGAASPGEAAVPDPGILGGAQAFTVLEGLFLLWALGAVLLFTLIAVHYARFARRVQQSVTPPDAELQALFSKQLRAMNMPDLVLLRLSPAIQRPGIFGIVNPVVLLPTDAARTFSPDVLADVMAHELAHIRRRDLLWGWFAAVMTCLYWFHPAVWWAATRMKREREMACDDLVLEATQQDGVRYATSILTVAERFAGVVPAGAGFLGMLERADNLTLRLRAAANGATPRRLSRPAAAACVALALAAFPMGGQGPGPVTEPAAPVDPDGPPRVVAMSPEPGAAHVNPERTELHVTFDRDMLEGFSWTGGGEPYPEITAPPYWETPRTAVLPVRLELGRYYRVGLNSTSFQNFRAVNGRPLPPQVIYFTTAGASAEERAKTAQPSVTALDPPNGAANLEPGPAELAVTFDRPMGAGFSFTGPPEDKPEFRAPPQWSADRRTWRVPVELEPNRTYTVSLNSEYHINFMSEHGVPLEPTPWTFSTAGE